MNATDEAAEWFIAQRTGELSMEEQKRFTQWLNDSAAHVREYLAIAELWGALPAARVVEKAKSGDLLQDLATVAPVATLTASGSSSPAWRTSAHKAKWFAVAAAVVCAVSGAAFWFVMQHSNDEFTTRRGEQRSLELPDGSVLQLNALSRVRVAYEDRRRRVELREGEALFRVAKDMNRPFEVATGDAVVRVIGTTFNVYHRGGDTRVAVVEGQVQVMAASAAPVPLIANESVSLVGGSVRAVPAEPRKVTAWTQRRLIFDEEPLGQVVAQFNLYNVEQLSVDDGELARLRINGVFDADDPQALVAYLRKVRGVEVEAKNNGIRLRGSSAH